MLLSDKVAVITGGSRGIGFAIAEAFGQHGAQLALLARTQNDLIQARNRLAKKRISCFIVRTDISKPKDVTRAVRKVFSHYGRIDVLVNNAGIYGPIGAVSKVDPEGWMQTIKTNLLGNFLMTKAVIPYFIKRKSGKIINLSGGGALKPFPNFSAYSASKAAIVRFTETLALELKKYKIDVNAISPGGVNTRLVDQVLKAGRKAAGEKFYAQIVKQKRGRSVPPEKAGALAVFLASRESNGLTGKVISAVHDDWRSIPKNIKKINASDAFTMRRVDLSN